MCPTICNWWKSCYHQRQLMQIIGLSRLASQQEASQENWFNLLNKNKVLAKSCYRGCLFVYIPYGLRTWWYRLAQKSWAINKFAVRPSGFHWMLDYLGHLYYVKLHLYVIRDLRAAAHNNLQTFQKGQSAALNPNAIQPDCLEHPPPPGWWT